MMMMMMTTLTTLMMMVILIMMVILVIIALLLLLLLLVILLLLLLKMMVVVMVVVVFITITSMTTMTIAMITNKVLEPILLLVVYSITIVHSWYLIYLLHFKFNSETPEIDIIMYFVFSHLCMKAIIQISTSTVLSQLHLCVWTPLTASFFTPTNSTIPVSLVKCVIIIKVILCASEHISSIVRYCFRSFKQL